MNFEERQLRIYDFLVKVEFASLEELAREVGSSVSSVRRDVTALAGRGVRRTHGGARLVRGEEPGEPVPQENEKERVARACAELIQSNQTVIIDAGTTCFHVARELESKRLHIFTNSLLVANHFAASQTVEVVVSGGVIYPRLGVLVGPLAVEAFSKAKVDVAIMSCGGVTPEGVTNSHGLLIDIQQAMMRAARRKLLCVDHTKFGRQSISRLCGLEGFDTIITDQLPPEEIRAAIRGAGVELIIAEASKATPQSGVPPSTTEEKKKAPQTSFAAPTQFID